MQTAELELKQDIYTISRLNSEVKGLLEGSFATVWVEGEISSFAAPGSGHWYFNLKDQQAQVRCAMFKGHSRKLGFTAQNGMYVLARARVSLYENRGEFQLIVDHMEERGEGQLRRQFELLKKKLELEGLFSPEHKKELPLFPRCIGIVTSPTGAAVRDILTVLKRRFPCVPVIIYPTLVQGTTAAPTIVKAIEIANERNECDVLIVTRGGGSLEDLWPFNEEIVARAIFASVLPIISGVGHEVDFTIADFVADKRAPTPSAAAEILTPDKSEMLSVLGRSGQAILRHIKAKLSNCQNQISWMYKTLNQQHPKRKLQEKMQLLDYSEAQLAQNIHKLIYKLQTKIKNSNLRINQLVPTRRISQLQNNVNLNQQRFHSVMLTIIAKQKTQLANCASKLDGLSPLATLQRGFAVATKDDNVIYSAKQVTTGDNIQVRLAEGSISCVVSD